MQDNRYSAEEVAKILKAEGDDSVSKRTVNYYAFEKNMFDIKESGKSCFTEEEVDKIRAIRLLKECSAFTLEQIKKIISKHSLDEIREICLDRVSTTTSLYGSPSYYKNSMKEENISLKETSAPKSRTIKINKDFTLVVSNKVSAEKLEKVVNFIRKMEERYLYENND